jgi:hypothetical protein
VAVHQLFIDFKKAYGSVRMQVLYNILIEFGINMELVRIINMCLSETYSRIQVSKYLSKQKSNEMHLDWQAAKHGAEIERLGCVTRSGIVRMSEALLT